MGNIWIVHEFEHHNWKQGVFELQQEADNYYGHQDGYTGAINSCSDIRLYSISPDVNTKKKLNDFLASRMERLDGGSGECIQLGQVGYSIAKPVIKEVTHRLPFNPLDFLEKGSPASIVELSLSAVHAPYSPFQAMACPTSRKKLRSVALGHGTVAEVKQRVKQLILQDKFQNDYYIVTKTKVYFCTGEGTKVKKTTKTSNSDQLVLPIYKWLVYGWAKS